MANARVRLMGVLVGQRQHVVNQREVCDGGCQGAVKSTRRRSFHRPSLVM
jgi:hypothetical protein